MKGLHRRHLSGKILVLASITMVMAILLGFTALAVDMRYLYSTSC